MKILAVLVFVTACTGDISSLGNTSVDAPETTAPTDAPLATVDAPSLCKPAVATVGDGHHNAGQDCQGGCHDHGFTLSGTLYNSPTGIAPMIGATVTIVDKNNKSVDAVSQQNGNFYTTEILVFPVMVRASACPDHVDMNAAVVAKSGCNSVGCHTPNVGQGVIHLP